MKKVFTVFSFALLGFSLYLIFFCGTEDKLMQVKPVSASTPSQNGHSSKSQDEQSVEQKKEDTPSAVQASGIR